MPRQSTRTRFTALGCVVLAGGLLLPPTATAEPTTTPKSLLESGRAVAARQAAAMKERLAAQTPQTPQNPKADLQSGSFFKTAAGIATLVIFGAGVGYALYSSREDRIRSTGR
jgi:hypothetical protein